MESTSILGMWMKWYDDNVFNSVILAWIFFFLLPLQMGMFAYHLFIQGFYHISVLAVLGFLFHVTGIELIDRKIMYLTCSISPMTNLLSNILLDRKKYNRACYLALTKKSYCHNASLSPAKKQWAVICESDGKGYCIFDSRGKDICDSKPKVEVMSRKTVEKVFFGFYPLGFTNNEIIRKFLRVRFKNPVTSFEYVHYTCNFLLRPPSSACQLTKFYGRVSYVCVIGLILLMGFINTMIDTNLFDLNIPIVIYYMFDYQTQTDSNYRDPIGGKESLSILISAVLYILFRMTGLWDFNGSILAAHALFTFLLFLYLKIVVKPFPFERVDVKPKLCLELNVFLLLRKVCM